MRPRILSTFVGRTREPFVFLPPTFSNFQVESDGVDDRTMARFKPRTGQTIREFQMKVAEHQPRRIPTESDTARAWLA